jgi:hypothetical protein
MGDARLEVKQRHVANCTKADPAYGAGVAKALGLTLAKAAAEQPVALQPYAAGDFDMDEINMTIRNSVAIVEDVWRQVWLATAAKPGGHRRAGFTKTSF